MSRETEPTQIRQGERYEWTREFDDYSAADYTLEYRFRGGGPGADVTATADGRKFKTVLTAAASLAFVPGAYQWQAWLTKISDSTVKFVVDSDAVTVERGFVSGDAADLDLRSKAKKIVDAIDDALLAAGASATIEYEISTPAGSRRIKQSREAALAQRKYYAGIVARENHAAGVRRGKPFAQAVKARLYGS